MRTFFRGTGHEGLAALLVWKEGGGEGDSPSGGTTLYKDGGGALKVGAGSLTAEAVSGTARR